MHEKVFTNPRPNIAAAANYNHSYTQHDQNREDANFAWPRVRRNFTTLHEGSPPSVGSPEQLRRDSQLPETGERRIVRSRSLPTRKQKQGPLELAASLHRGLNADAHGSDPLEPRRMHHISDLFDADDDDDVTTVKPSRSTSLSTSLSSLSGPRTSSPVRRKSGAIGDVVAGSSFMQSIAPVAICQSFRPQTCFARNPIHSVAIRYHGFPPLDLIESVRSLLVCRWRGGGLAVVSD